MHVFTNPIVHHYESFIPHKNCTGDRREPRCAPDSILEVLQDGEPHHVRELAERMKLTLKELDRG